MNQVNQKGHETAMGETEGRSTLRVNPSTQVAQKLLIVIRCMQFRTLRNEAQSALPTFPTLVGLNQA